MRIFVIIVLYFALYIGTMIPTLILLGAIFGHQLDNPRAERILDFTLGLGGFVWSGLLLNQLVKKIGYFKPYLLEVEALNLAAERIPAPGARMAAVLVDTLIVLGLLFGVSRIITVFELKSSYATITGILLVFVLYEPLCVYFFKGSPGHYWRGFRVMNAAGGRVNIPVAIIRFLIKSSLGLFSFILMFLGDRRAIQDIVTKTKVVYH